MIRTVDYGDTIPGEITEALTFVMAHLDEVPGRPAVSIEPAWILDGSGGETRAYTVHVRGTEDE